MPWLIPLILAGFVASAGAADRAQPLVRGPVPVELSLVVIDLSGVDDTLQQYSVNLFIRMEWTDRTLALEGADRRTLNLDEVWNPRLEITNEILVRESLPRTVDVTADGRVTYYQRLVGSLAQAMDLRDFPFDRQSFSIRFAAVGFRPGDIEWIVSRETAAMLAGDWSVSNWKLIGWDISD